MVKEQLRLHDATTGLLCPCRGTTALSMVHVMASAYYNLQMSALVQVQLEYIVSSGFDQQAGHAKQFSVALTLSEGPFIRAS